MDGIRGGLYGWGEGYVWEVWDIAYFLNWEDSYKGAGRYYMEMY